MGRAAVAVAAIVSRLSERSCHWFCQQERGYFRYFARKLKIFGDALGQSLPPTRKTELVARFRSSESKNFAPRTYSNRINGLRGSVQTSWPKGVCFPPNGDAHPCGLQRPLPVPSRFAGADRLRPGEWTGAPSGVRPQGKTRSALRLARTSDELCGRVIASGRLASLAGVKSQCPIFCRRFLPGRSFSR